MLLERNFSKIYMSNPFIKQKRKVIEYIAEAGKLERVFPDKLRDLQKFEINILLVKQSPKINLVLGKFEGVDIEVLRVAVEHMNAKLITKASIAPNDRRFDDKFFNHMVTDVHLTPNTAFTDYGNNVYWRYVNTYDEDEYCALVPIPPRLTFLDFLLTPYDAFSWSLLILSIAVCAVFWKLLQRRLENSDSAWHFVFGIAVTFFGQSISFRENRRMQVTLLQLCILMTFIMGNAYESLIIASMSSSRDGIRFKTFDEMFNSDLKFIVDPIFYKIFLRSRDSSSVSSRLEVENKFVNLADLVASNYAIIGRCDLLEYEMNIQIHFNIAKHFYMLSERIMKFYATFPMAPLSPFYGKLQLNYDYIFESGIRQYWKHLFEMKKTAQINRYNEYVKNEEYLLTMEDVYGIFYILLVGNAIGLIVIILEMFWHGCAERLPVKSCLQNLKTKLMRNRRRMNVRFIQVQPVQV